MSAKNSVNSTKNGLQSVAFRRIVRLTGILKRGAWLQFEGQDVDDLGNVTSRDERYADIEQFGGRLDDDSVDQIYPAGAIVIYADKAAVGIRSDSLLVVRRTRVNKEVELSVWQVVERGGKMLFSTASKSLSRQVEIPSTAGGDIAAVDILGVVISAMLPAPGLTGPMLNLSQQEERDA